VKLLSAETQILLKVTGINLTDNQLTRLGPYLVPVRRMEIVAGSVRSPASEFARRGSSVLALDHASGVLAVGSSDGDSSLRNTERFASPEMAVRVFLSSSDEPAGSAQRLSRSGAVLALIEGLIPFRSRSVALLALVEGFIAFLALYIAVLVRFETPFSHIRLLEQQLGPLWPRALLFSLIVVLSLSAFGLYSARQRQLSGVLVRVVVALIIASCGVAALFYLVPSLRLWRGVEALAVIAAGCGVMLSRLLLAVSRGLGSNGR